LRRAHADKVEQFAVEAGAANLPFKAEHGLDDAGIYVHEIDSSVHDVYPLHE
jgi:hypothetical protein